MQSSLGGCRPRRLLLPAANCLRAVVYPPPNRFSNRKYPLSRPLWKSSSGLPSPPAHPPPLMCVCSCLRHTQPPPWPHIVSLCVGWGGVGRRGGAQRPSLPHRRRHLCRGCHKTICVACAATPVSMFQKRHPTLHCRECVLPALRSMSCPSGAEAAVVSARASSVNIPTYQHVFRGMAGRRAGGVGRGGGSGQRGGGMDPGGGGAGDAAHKVFSQDFFFGGEPRNNQHNPQYANYWAPLTHKRHIPPHPAQPQHTNDWAPRTRKRHQQEHRPQRPTERSDPTQHAKGRTGDCPGPRKETTTRRNVTRGGGGGT